MMEKLQNWLKSKVEIDDLLYVVAGSILGLLFRLILGVLLPHLFAVIGSVAIVGALGALKEYKISENPNNKNLRWTILGGVLGAL